MKRLFAATLVVLGSVSGQAADVVLFCERVDEKCVGDECSMNHVKTTLAIDAQKVVATGNDLGVFRLPIAQIKNVGIALAQEQMGTLLDRSQSEWVDREKDYSVFMNETPQKVTYLLVGRELQGASKMVGQIWFAEIDFDSTGAAIGGRNVPLACSK